MAATHAQKVIAASQACTAGGSVVGTQVDNSAGYGMLVVGRCVNGATGPNAACQMQVYVGSVTGEKRLYQILPFDLGNAVTSDRVCEIPPSAMFVNVTFTGNTGQDVTVEALAEQLTGI